MRKVHTLGVTLFGAVVAIACGGTATSDNPPGSGADAGYDATGGNNNNNPVTDGGDASSPPASDAGDDAAVCIIDADILTLAPVDAALNDAGASVGSCLACAQTTCNSGLSECNADCTCNQGFTCFAQCIGGVGNSLLTCAGQCFGSIAAVEANPAEEAVVLCAAEQCTNECAAAGLLGGGGGKKDGGNTGDDGGSVDGAAD
jgi:hypothetical protein